MVFCYSATGKSRAYAEVFADVLNGAGQTGATVIPLESDLDPSRKFSFFIGAVFKKTRVINMPGLDSLKDGDIYICGPVWAGKPAGPIKYFLENAPLNGKRVNVLLTAGVSHDKYAVACKKVIEGLGHTPGQIHVFAVPKTGIDKDIAAEHIRKLFLSEDEDV